MIITSKNNELIKSVRALKQKKARDEQGCYIVEGEKSVLDAYATKQEIKYLFVTEKYALNFEKYSPITVSDLVFQSLTDEVTPQGVLAVVKIPKSAPITQLTHCLLLDRVQDPGNVGAIIRTAVACGVKHIFAIDSADFYSPKVVRSSMGGLFRISVTKITESQAISLLNEQNVPLLSADMSGENLFCFNPPKRFCLCVGNEGQGISATLTSASNHKVSIPMQNGMESLNVAVATSVTLYTLLNNSK